MAKRILILLLKGIGISLSCLMLYLGGVRLYLAISNGLLRAVYIPIWKMAISGSLQIIVALVILYFIFRRKRKI